MTSPKSVSVSEQESASWCSEPQKMAENVSMLSASDAVIEDKICSGLSDLSQACHVTPCAFEQRKRSNLVSKVFDEGFTNSDIFEDITHMKTVFRKTPASCEMRQMRRHLATQSSSHVTKISSNCPKRQFTQINDNYMKENLTNSSRKSFVRTIQPCNRLCTKCRSRHFSPLKNLFIYSVFVIVIFLAHHPVLSAKTRHLRKRQRDTDLGVNEIIMPMFPNAGSNEGLYPSMVNLAAQARIVANATCGENGPEQFCKLVEHVHRISRRRRKRSQCDICSSHPHQSHDIEYAIDGRGSRWWQSPTISSGYEYHWVTITLDLKQVFQVAYFIFKAGNSPRPGNWILEKSLDGITWQAWQYFAVTDSECRHRYPARVTRMGSPKFRYDNEVVCTSFFSQLLPLQNGEIHISMINGRPSAENPSDELIKFTSARYVRLRFQKIRTLHADLMTISGQPAEYVDQSVTQRYFYSVKDISIGGMCICYGHAHDCPSHATTGKFICKCEHNTMGDNCEQCRPKFNQYKWSPGNGGFQCEECNCYGHADSCYYDENVEWRKESINMEGQRKGGGVCIDCQDHTAGINCDSCVDGYFRPTNVPPEDVRPCRPCDCDTYGARTNFDGRQMCRKTTEDGGAHQGMQPGDCYCKDGYAGSKCERCDFGFRGYPRCEPCQCNPAGSLNMDPCHGPCLCKENVIGPKCDECKNGYFNLERQSPLGCETCYCSGITNLCESAVLYRRYIRNMRGWEVVDRPASHTTVPSYDENLNEPYVSHEETARAVCTGLYFWKPPNEYIGNKLSSYGGELRYTIYYELPTNSTQSSPIKDIDVILEGNGISLEFSRQREVQSYVSTPFVVPFKEGTGWMESNSGRSATKDQILQALSDVKRLLIRASYNRNGNAEFRIRDVSMDVAAPDGEGERVTSVEQCHCPPGYDGTSCEDCAEGYFRSGRECIKCECNGRSKTCNLYTGVCEKCENGTMGMRCELCQPGYYEDTGGGCIRCACPLVEASNNFSPTCVLDEFDNVVHCLNCPTGYEGLQCERCADSYYGDPTSIGDVCKRCECNGNAYTCGKSTGECIACRGNTAGRHCEQCANGFYGDPIIRKNCTSCRCDLDGAVSRQCDPVTGQCPCRPDVFGKRCDTCQEGQYLDRTRKICAPCLCDAQGSLGSGCGVTGDCVCKVGVVGMKCDQCSVGYFDFGNDGCKECDCPQTNQHCDPVTGACVCPPHTTGPGCTLCTPNAYGWHTNKGCKECNCHGVGSKSSQCDEFTGECDCKDEYTGKQCNACSDGFYDFPNCLPCVCNLPGTVSSSCQNNTGICTCSNAGQCQCKKNVVGVKCNRCAEGTFSLLRDNPKGCTDCYCSGVTDECTQAVYHWGDAVSLSVGSQVMVANQVNTRSTSEGVIMTKNAGTVSMDPGIVRRTMRYEPYYWRLPPQFSGDKLTSYNGFLRFKIFYSAAIGDSVHKDAPTVVIRGLHKATTIGYKLEEPTNNVEREYVLTMREDGWTYLDTDIPVSRDDFALTLTYIDFFLIKASYGQLMDQSRLSDVFLDVAVEGTGGRGDSSSSGPPALGVEICECPPGYTGLSCQICDTGYMRIRTGKYLGECRPCACNGKSDICDVNTGTCIGCKDNFVGDRCEQCALGFYLTSGPSGPVCKKCLCPLGSPENNFSPTCHSDGSDGYRCDACPAGYTGIHCEQCSPGHFGDPMSPGGFCQKCGCNPSGSTSLDCDRITGKCNCQPGITGRVCDQCRPRHAITEDGCIPCDDECSGKLLEEIEALTTTTRAVDLNNLFPPPWDRLLRAENKTHKLQPFLKILLHRRREFEVYRCRMLKGFMDEALTNAIDTVTVVTELKPELQKLNSTLDKAVDQSKMCYLDGEDVVYQANRTHHKVQKRKEKIEGTIKNIDELSGRLRRLLERLQNGTVIDDSEIVVGIAELITQLRNRDLSKYKDVADEELRLADELMDRVIEKFTNTSNDVINRYNQSKQKIAEKIHDALDKLEDLLQKALAARTIAMEVDKMNNMNNQTIRQLKADIERLENEVVMVEIILKDTRRVINETENAIRRTANFIEDLKMRGDKLRQMLQELMRESDKIAMVQDQLILLKLLVKQAREHERELVELADYFQKVYNNISGTSFNQTDAATRYPRIVEIMNKANKTAYDALGLSMDATELGKGNLNERAEAALDSAMDLVNEVSNMKDTIKSEKQKLRQVKNQTRVANITASDLEKKFNKIKKSINKLNTDMSPNPNDVIEKAEKTNAMSDEVMAAAMELEKKVNDLENAVEIANNYSDVIKEIRDNPFWVESVPDVLKKANDKVAEGKLKQNKNEMKSDEVRSRIDDLRKQIEETRMKAASIRKASVKSEGLCTMRYLPRVAPGRITDIVLQFMSVNTNNTLFYMGRDEADYILIQTINGYIHVTWDLGSGKGEILNPVDVTKNPLLEKDWFRVEISRLDSDMNVTVYQMIDKDGTEVTIPGTSPGESFSLDIDERDNLYIGGVPQTVKLPDTVPVRSFTGCMGEATLQKKLVGMWNFREVSDPSHCDGCFASPQDKPSTSPTVYGFNGESYTVLQEPLSARGSNHLTLLDFEFKTFSTKGLLLYKGSSITNDFASVELVDGRIVARINLGNGMHILTTEKRYNTGKWIKTFFRRLQGKVQLIARSSATEVEMLKLQINGSDGLLNMTSTDLTCIGGCPSQIVLTHIFNYYLSTPVQETGFVGCMKGLSVFGVVQPLSGSGNNVLRFSQVDTTCPAEVSRDIGIDDDGFVELNGHNLPTTGSVSITFNSMEPDALLLLATDDVTSRRKRRRRQSNNNFYSLSLNAGHVEARLRTSNGSPLILRSKSSIYSDGDEHTAQIRRENEVIQLIIDDRIMMAVSGTLPKGGGSILSVSRIYVGGLPKMFEIKDMAQTNSSLNGCIRELVTDRLVDFNEAVQVSNSYFGTCVYTQTAALILPPVVVPTPPTTETRTRIQIRSTTPSVTPSALQTVTIPPTVARTTATTGCVPQGDLPVLKGTTVKFGRSAHSHMQFAFDDNIEAKFRVQIEFRTFASDGVLLYASSDEYSDFFSLQLKNGKPVFRFDSGKGAGETSGNFSVNDGKWHTVRIARSKRKGCIKVDNMRYRIAKSPHGKNRMDVTKILYIGGIPADIDSSKLSGMWQSVDTCVRSVSLNKNKLDLRKPSMSNNVGQCHEYVEKGAYFDGSGYAVYNNEYRVGPVMSIELEFRTWSRDGVLVTISDSSRSDGLALEIVNGTIYFRVNNGAGNIYTQYTPKLNIPNVALCDGNWHKLKATKSKNLLTLTVDDRVSTDPGTPMGDQKSADTKDPLYIGGYPDDALQQRQITTKLKFRGCIRKMKLKGQTVDFSLVHEYRNIYPNSCPTSKS
uniref:laminin subunit alpha-1-like isoform X3 n=1 Tax=Styela clava TaxID=7725 RepID=UPI001939FF19|nr:laminin subunit alpha-1-like isoform X3 [Styela clava]